MRLLTTAAGLLAAALTLLPVAADASDVTLRVGNYGGRFTETQRRYAADAFTARTGIKVEFIDSNPLDHIAKLIATKGREPPFDVVYLDSDIQPQAIEAGILQKLDPAIVTNLAHVYDEAKNPDGYGPGMLFADFGILYNTEKYAAAGIPAPTKWSDLWDERLAGHVVVGELSHGCGRALLVQAERLAGGDESTPEKGIDKIAEIKVHSYISSTVQLEALFPTGDVWAAVIANGRAWGLIDKGLPLAYVRPEGGSVASITTIDVTAGTLHPREANLFVNEVIGPVAQLGQAFEIPYGPTNKLVTPIIQAYPDLARKLPGTLQEIQSLYRPNWPVYWANHETAVDLWGRRVIRK
ncbi:ABC transporter substrate-binding protein [Zavarzinia sp. CC-PAN008]|uniref:ABC transporter substrate-binding protein n=1 Tax=Zavarzinia sp. CC-PAN008 TaxID=3243332 RepID=UPI003F74680B